MLSEKLAWPRSMAFVACVCGSSKRMLCYVVCSWGHHLGKCPCWLCYDTFRCPFVYPWRMLRPFLHFNRPRRVYTNPVTGRPQCNRGFPGFPGKCQKNVKMPIWMVPGKCWIQSKQNVQWGPGSVDFGSPENVNKMSNMLCWDPKMAFFEHVWYLFTIFDIFWHFPGDPPKYTFWHLFDMFDIAFYISGRPSQIDILTFLLTFPGKSRKTPVTLGSSGYGNKQWFAKDLKCRIRGQRQSTEPFKSYD